MSNKVGSWVDCTFGLTHPRLLLGKPVKFFRKPTRPAHLMDICDLCLFKKREENGTLLQSPHGSMSSAQVMHSASCTPERDSL